MKRVALVGVSAQMSGVEYSTLYLTQRLDRAHWLPIVICPAEGELPQRCRACGIEVVIVPQARFFSTSARLGARTVPNPFAWGANLPALWHTARLLTDPLRQMRPDLIVPKGLLAQFYGGLAAWWCGIPCVWHIQDRVSERAGPLFPFCLGLGARWLARHVIVDAQSIARQIQNVVGVDRISVIWNGVDLNEFSPAVVGTGVRVEWGIAPDEILIGSVSRLVPWKGQHILLEAFARLAADFPNTRLVLVGSALFDTDAYARRLRARADELGLQARVLFPGYRQDTPQILAALDIFCHSALEKDSTPLAVVSALAAGKAIVCSAVDGTAELFQAQENGLLFPPGDVPALTERLTRLLRDRALRTRLGQNAREFAERELSVAQYAHKCESVFARALT